MKSLGNDRPYWTAMEAGRLELPQCSQCKTWHWPAPFRCGSCGSWDIDWLEVQPEGTLFSWTRTWHPFEGSEGLGSPYVSVLVELPQAGGIRLLGVLEGEENPAIGMPMTGRIAETHAFGRDIPSLRWSPA